MEQKEFSWLGDVSRSRLKQDMAHISQWVPVHRFLGREACVDYILGQLREFGIPCWAESFEFLRSYPIITRLQVEENGVFRPVQALAAVFSASCQDLQGPLWCDEATNGTDLEESRQFSAMRGKIVLTHRRHGEDILKAFHHGALAVISVWDTPEEKLHHNTIGTVWGGPAPENLWRFGSVPAVCVTKREGEKLWQDAARGPGHPGPADGANGPKGGHGPYAGGPIFPVRGIAFCSLTATMIPGTKGLPTTPPPTYPN